MRHINPKNLIYLTIFCLPSYLIKVSIFGFPTNILELLIGLVLLFWLLDKNKEVHLKDFFSKYKHYFFSIGLIFFGLLVSTFSNDGYLSGLGIIKGWFLAPILFAAVTENVLWKKERENLYLSYFLSALAVSLVSWGYLLGGNLTFDGRLAAFYNSPNYLAMYIAPALFIGYELLEHQAKQIENGQGVPTKKFWLFLVSLAIILVALYFTCSYASWLAVFIAFCLIVFIKRKFVRKSLALLFVFLALVLAFQANQEKFSRLTNLDPRSSAASRMMIWESGQMILADNWIWGIGPGNFQKEYLRHQEYFPPYLEWAVPHPHDIYLAFWLYGGIIGLIGFISLMFFWVRDLIRKYKPTLYHPERDHKILFIGLGMMLYVLLHGLVDTTYFKNDLAVIFWINFFAVL